MEKKLDNRKKYWLMEKRLDNRRKERVNRKWYQIMKNCIR